MRAGELEPAPPKRHARRKGDVPHVHRLRLACGGDSIVLTRRRIARLRPPAVPSPVIRRCQAGPVASEAPGFIRHLRAQEEIGDGPD